MIKGVRSRLLVLGTLVACLSACEEGTLPNTTGLAAAAGTPILSAVEAASTTSGSVALRARATDPKNRPLSFAWRVSDGQLASSSGSAVNWRLPKVAGTYTATVEVTNADGLKVTGQQTFTVTADGKASEVGDLSVQAAATNTVNRGFAIPSPLGSQKLNAVIVGANQFATPPSPGAPTSPVAQPVATPAPLPPTPIPPALQPIATPTPTPPPLVVPPSPLPTALPATAQPGVPAPPPVVWRTLDPSRIPSREGLVALHFPTENEGWLAGTGGTVLRYTRTGDAEPVLTLRKPQDTNSNFYDIYFTSSEKGFVAGANTEVWRTLDGGLTWQNISPVPAFNGNYISSLVVFNEQIVLAAENGGRIWRTENANAATTDLVTWTEQPSLPRNRPADIPRFITAGAGAPNDTSLTYWVGDGIYMLDSDAPDINDRWKRLYTLKTTVGDSDGDLLSIKMITPNNIWAGSNVGNLFHSADGGREWKTLKHDQFINREFNGNSFHLSNPAAIYAISAPDEDHLFLGTQSGIIDTQNAREIDNINSQGPTWARLYNGYAQDLQVNSTIRNNAGTFVGWGVGSNALHLFLPR